MEINTEANHEKIRKIYLVNEKVRPRFPSGTHLLKDPAHSFYGWARLIDIYGSI